MRYHPRCPPIAGEHDVGGRRPAAGQPPMPYETRTFGALAPGLTELVAWLTAHGAAAAAMEATGVYWQAPWEVLTEAGIEAQLLNARQVKQLRGRKTDVEDSRTPHCRGRRAARPRTDSSIKRNQAPGAGQPTPTSSPVRSAASTRRTGYSAAPNSSRWP